MACDEVCVRSTFGYISRSKLCFSETGPTQGTLKVFPDVLLSNAYLILRPFFKPLVANDSKEIFDAKNWEYGLFQRFK